MKIRQHVGTYRPVLRSEFAITLQLSNWGDVKTKLIYTSCIYTHVFTHTWTKTRACSRSIHTTVAVDGCYQLDVKMP